MSARIMAHMVSFFPDEARSREVAQALVEGGAWALEIQFPFSDPTADGPAIQEACTRALEAGFTVEKGFRFLEWLKGRWPDLPVFLMCYGSIPVRKGVDPFVERCAELGLEGLIVPDLPPDYDEGLYEAGARHGIPVVPVVIPQIRGERLSRILSLSPAYVYAALRKGITGYHTEIGEENLSLLDTLEAAGTRTLAGFGIDSPEQVALLAPHVHAVVVGSAFVRVIASCSGSPAAPLKAKIGELLSSKEANRRE
ncbi:Tryptophan synthase alpha chain [Spirochaeta thermophila DSM 6578]|uniref:Tryptophan synthase alpha chain n=1 Tax=Winmispira thermophila (strain ATCC 700085 / DSM 6578 / Z-1203) TaxID=869211 RepID=G0GCN7_WINT7|nr:tryptophan synthase subunit alpha [Spirochaeta thermophila]AEJ60456.1 Tryptophan synthase alpha chain [Spirochaeta thermophila DSM 6578]